MRSATMKSATIIVTVLAVFTAAGVQAEQSRFANWQELQEELVGKVILREWIPMRDGVRLDAEIYLPKAGKAPYPVILIRSPYPSDKLLQPNETYEAFLEGGYALVYQYERGRYWSEGEHEYLARAADDGYDTVDWVAKQEWSNGRVGTIGCSSTAENQLRLMSAAHPAHRAAIAQAPGAGIGNIGPYFEQGNTFRGGAPQLLFASWYHNYIWYSGAGDPRPQYPADMSQEDRVRVSKYFKLEPNFGWGVDRPDFDYAKYYSHLPVGDLNIAAEGPRTDWDRFVRRSPNPEEWKDIHLSNEGDTFGVPALWVFSWYDVSVAPNVALYNYAREHTSTDRAKGNQQMIIGPMPHCQFGKESRKTVVGDRDLGDARYDYVARYVEWFDRWLKEEKNGASKQDPVRWYQMGANEWRTAETFPPARTEYRDFYLESGGAANGLYGNGTLVDELPAKAASDGYVYDPLRPVQTHGGGACCMGDIKATGALDQSTLEMRSDILVYSTPVLEEDLEIAGFVEVELFVSSDAKDTDFTVKLIDVYPDGTAYNLDDNIFRARYRDGYDQKVLMEEGKVYKLELPPMITANSFKAGHRLRIEVSSSNFPRYDRNLNTGGNNYDESKPVVARNRIHHGGDYPSRIRIPVLPRS